jgi:hypothetical protein
LSQRPAGFTWRLISEVATSAKSRVVAGKKRAEAWKNKNETLVLHKRDKLTNIDHEKEYRLL